jgi:hypothetical protein
MTTEMPDTHPESDTGYATRLRAGFILRTFLMLTGLFPMTGTRDPVACQPIA